MKMILNCCVAATLALAMSPTAFAAGEPTVLKVSLRGEADQPMSVVVDNTTLKTGPVELVVTNDAIGTDHEVVLVKIKKGEKITADMTKHRVDEAKLDSLGEVEGLKPGASGTLKVELTEGDYMLLCNFKGHYEMGMSTPISVSN
jgi:uncharacterized cupredoxin-like copper-binding protein